MTFFKKQLTIFITFERKSNTNGEFKNVNPGDDTVEKVENKELRDLATHQAGAVDLHETRETSETVAIYPPEVPNPGPYDTRTGLYEVQHNSKETSEEE
jgi:hypothetical protein